MSTTKARLLAQFPGFENELSPGGRAALLKALLDVNGDSFIVIRTAYSPNLKKNLEEAAIRYVALNDADAAVFFGSWENSPLNAISKKADVRLLPMLIVHEA